MPRSRPEERLDRVAEAAARVFLRRGYRRARMEEVAREAGVAAGTLYNYVASKDALFDLVVLRAFAPDPAPPPELPVPTPPPDELLSHVRRRLGGRGALPALRGVAEAAPSPPEAAAELEAVVGELYDWLARDRTGIALLDRVAGERPELASLWYGRARGGYLGRLEQYLRLRIAQGRFRPVPDVAAAARLVLETASWFAWKRQGDARPGAYDDAVARETVLHFVKRALLREEVPA